MLPEIFRVSSRIRIGASWYCITWAWIISATSLDREGSLSRPWLFLRFQDPELIVRETVTTCPQNNAKWIVS